MSAIRGIDLSDLSEDELGDLIGEATRRRAGLRESRLKEEAVGPTGSIGQNVRDPDHGAIPAPTPNAVKEDGPLHGA